MRHNIYKPIQQVRDSLAIRATCFHPSGEVYVIGTLSKALKICKYPTKEQLNGFNDRTCMTNNNITTDFSLNNQSHQPYDDRLAEPEIAFTCLQIHCGSVYCTSFNQSGTLLATGSNDQTVHVIKYNHDKLAPEGSEYKLAQHSGTVRDIAFMTTNTPAQSLLISAGAGDNEINVTDCESMKLAQVFRGHESAVMSLRCFHNSHHTFVSGSLDGTIRIWDLRSDKYVSMISPPSELSNNQPTTDSATAVQQPTIIADGGDNHDDSIGDQKENLQTGYHTNGSHLVDGAMQQQQYHIVDDDNHHHHDGQKGIPIGVVRLDPTDRLLVSGHRDGSCMLYDIRGSQMIQMFKAHEDEIRTLNFSPNSYYLLTASYDKRVKLMDLQGQLTNKLPSVELVELEDRVVQTAWHPNDYNFVTTCANGTATLWAIPDFETWINEELDDFGGSLV